MFGPGSIAGRRSNQESKAYSLQRVLAVPTRDAGYFILFLRIIDRAFRGAPIGPVSNTFTIIAWVAAFIISVGLGDFTAKKARAGNRT